MLHPGKHIGYEVAVYATWLVTKEDRKDMQWHLNGTKLSHLTESMVCMATWRILHMGAASFISLAPN